MHLLRQLAGSLALLGTSLAATPGLAAPRHQDITGPGGYMNACAAPSSPGAARTPGVDITADYTSGGCEVQYFTGNGSASASASYAGSLGGKPIVNASAGSVGIGHIHLSSSNQSPNNAFFAAASVSGGFEDRLTLNLPGFNGQTVYMLVDMAIDGQLAAQWGGSSIEVTGYMNTNELVLGNPGFQLGGSDLFTTDRQRVRWGINGGPQQTRLVDDRWTFSVPVVVGSAFDLGVYARAISGQSSYSSSTALTASQLDFGHTIQVLGVTGLIVGSQTLSEGYTITAASGLDWTQPLAVPEPDGVALMLAGLGVVAARVQRRWRGMSARA